MKKKYPKIKTEKMLFEKLHCVFLIDLTDYGFQLKKPFVKTVLVEIAK